MRSKNWTAKNIICIFFHAYTTIISWIPRDDDTMIPQMTTTNKLERDFVLILISTLEEDGEKL